MYSKTVTITNPSGLHARPAAVFVKTASEFASTVLVRRAEDGTEGKDAKSILTLMGLGLGSGTEIEISAEGADEQEAVNALVELVESGCGE